MIDSASKRLQLVTEIVDFLALDYYNFASNVFYKSSIDYLLSTTGGIISNIYFSFGSDEFKIDFYNSKASYNYSYSDFTIDLDYY